MSGEPTERQRYWLDRLDANVLSAEVRLARAAERVESARSRGVDTSAFDPATSATSADYTLGKLEAELRQRQKELDAYRRKIGAEP